MATSTSTGRVIGAEFVGTALVMLGGPGLIVLGGDDVGRLEIAIGFGLSAALAIGVIGAVANPMFSLALWFGRSITRKELFADWAGQVLGGAFGAALLFGLNDATRVAAGTNGYDTGGVGKGIDLGYNLSGFSDLGVVLAAEFVLGIVLVVILLAAVQEHTSNATSAAFVGGGVTLAALFLQPISGFGLNPARSIGIAIFADTDPNALAQVWAFVVVPLAASLAGLLVWVAISDQSIDDTVFDDTALETATDLISGD